jgi:hypothetical protein
MSHDRQIPDDEESELEIPLEELESAKAVYDSIWAQFAIDRKNNRAQAYAQLQQNFAKHAAQLVPAYMTAKEHVSIIGDIEQYTKGDQQSASGDPQQLISAWLRGDADLSRIPLEKAS